MRVQCSNRSADRQRPSHRVERGCHAARLYETRNDSSVFEVRRIIDPRAGRRGRQKEPMHRTVATPAWKSGLLLAGVAALTLAATCGQDGFDDGFDDAVETRSSALTTPYEAET